MSKPMSGIRPIGRLRRRLLRRLLRSESGEAMLSFGFLLPILVMLSFGVLDFGIVMLDYGRAHEATRRGARVAAITDSVANLDTVETSDVVCTGSGGSVSCSGGGVINATGFATILTNMQTVLPDITPENVQITYRHSGLGTPAAGGVKPFVSVALVGYRHQMMLLSTLPGMPDEITLPGFATTEMLKYYQSP